MEKKYLVGMFSVLVLAMFVVGMNIGNVKDSTAGDNLKYGSDVCIYKNDELIECKHNTVTTAGLNMVASALAYGEAMVITNLTLGNGTTPIAAHTALDSLWITGGLEGATGTVNSNGNGNWSVAHTWTSTGDTQLVNITGLYNATNNILFAGTSFTATTLQTDDQLKVNYTLYVT